MKKISVFLFVVSTLFFVVLLVLSLEFVIACKDFQIETSGDVLGGMVLTTVYVFAFLIISVLGLVSSIPNVKSAYKKAIKICLYVEIGTFSAGTIFSVFQLLLHF